ncbi:Enolase [Hexamita inflata]|uniref:phosphopyruvate hydratase n=3 Tax=Hexamita inflata TaxID=28002 RepID=A0AA86VP10_9EUKA|nr:Enolase [Hexamita inflata]
MSKITNIATRAIYDARGQPTPEVEIQTACGTFRASAPSQSSFSRHDCVELKDNEPRSWGGRGSQKCIDAIRTRIRPVLTGFDIQDINEVDKKLKEIDESPDGRMGTIGTNASLPISMACIQASAAYNRTPLFKYISKLANTKAKMPNPCFSLVSGGLSGGLTFVKDYYITAIGQIPLQDQLQNYSLLQQEVRKQLQNKTTISHTGGFMIAQDTVEEVLKVLTGWIKSAGLDGKVGIILDCAANDIADPKQFTYEVTKFNPDKPKQVISGAQMIEKYVNLCTANPAIIAIIDPFYYEDFGNCAELISKVKKVQVFGQQMFSSRVDRVPYFIKHDRGQLASNVVIQMTSVGLISEVIKTARKAKEMNIPISVTTSNGETEDVFVAHLAVGLGADYFFVGGMQRSDRIEKVNELARIAELL